MDTRIAAGIAGFAATIPMTAAMAALQGSLPAEQQHALPPRHITENAAAVAGVSLGDTEAEHKASTLAAHFGYGAAAGAGYAAFAGKTGLDPAKEGALYGLAVWGGSYLGLMPATGLYKSATEEPTARNLVMIAAHVVWGAALGVITDMLAGQPKR